MAGSLLMSLLYEGALGGSRSNNNNKNNKRSKTIHTYGAATCIREMACLKSDSSQFVSLLCSLPVACFVIAANCVRIVRSACCLAVRIPTSLPIDCAGCAWGPGGIEPAHIFMPQELKSHPNAGATHRSHGVFFRKIGLEMHNTPETLLATFKNRP